MRCTVHLLCLSVSNLMNSDLLLQVIPVLTFLFCCWSFIQASDNTMKWSLSLINVALAVYSFYQGLHFGAAVFLLAGVRTFITIYSTHWVLGLILVLGHCVIPLYIEGTDYLSIIAGIGSVIAFFVFNGWKLRVTQGMVSTTWAVNAYMYDAYALLFSEACLALICYVMAFRMAQLKLGRIQA